MAHRRVSTWEQMICQDKVKCAHDEYEILKKEKGAGTRKFWIHPNG